MRKNKEYQVDLVLSYEDNKGNPDVETTRFLSYVDASLFYKESLRDKCKEHGKTCNVMLIECEDQSNNASVIMESYQESELLPSGCVIVTYKHLTFMNYAYQIVDVRTATEDERYEDLNVSEDHTNTNWDEVYGSVKELVTCYGNRIGIFGKVQKGSIIIDRFLAEQGIEGYEIEEE